MINEDILSATGKKAFFPKSGILTQTAEAKGTEFNATIGQAFESDGEPMVLDGFLDQVKLGKQSFLYSPSYGQKELREIWLALIKQKNPSLQSNITLPIVTSGLTHGLYLVGKLFVDEGDEIIIPDKIWGNYNLIFSNAKFNQFPCFVDNKFNLVGLREKLVGNVGKKIVLLNFPNNPTGYTLTEEEAEEIVKIIKESADEGNDLIVICDDAYFGLVYEEGICKESIFAKLADLHERVLTVKVDGITKETYSWGLRVGFLTFGFKGMDSETAAVLEDKTAGLVRGTISNVCTHSQLLAIKALENPDLLAQTKEKYDILKERYDLVKKTLQNNPQYEEFFTALLFNSGYFMCVKLKKGDAEEVRKKLISDYSTGIIAVGNMLRIAYSSLGKDKIPKLFENIYLVCKN